MPSSRTSSTFTLWRTLPSSLVVSIAGALAGGSSTAAASGARAAATLRQASKPINLRGNRRGTARNILVLPGKAVTGRKQDLLQIPMLTHGGRGRYWDFTPAGQRGS